MHRPLALVSVLGLLTPLLWATAPPPAAADGVVSDDARTFVDAYPGLTLETFESSPAESNNYVLCQGPLSSGAATACFPRGGLRPGVRYLAEPGGAADEMAVFGAGLEFNETRMLVANHTDDTLVIDFTSPVDTVGLELASDVGPTCAVSVRYVDHSAATDATVPGVGDEDLDFLTVKADRLIDQIRISSIGAEFIDDVRFGLRAPNRFSFGGVRRQPTAGTAALAVRVPAIGTTTLTGPSVVRSAVDSARPRTVVLPVAARGAALRTLRQRGRVTVRASVTFRPNGGTARTRILRITLVNRR